MKIFPYCIKHHCAFSAGVCTACLDEAPPPKAPTVEDEKLISDFESLCYLAYVPVRPETDIGVKLDEARQALLSRLSEQAPAQGMDKMVRVGLQLIVRSYIYTNDGPIGAAKVWIDHVLKAGEPQGQKEGVG